MLQLDVCGPCGHLLNRYNKLCAFRRFRNAAALVVDDAEQAAAVFVAAGQEFLLHLRQHHAERIRLGSLDPRHAAKPCGCEVRNVDPINGVDLHLVKPVT